jgi:hypothetical protein
MKISLNSGIILIKYYETAIKQNFLDIRKRTPYFLQTLQRTLNNITDFSWANGHPFRCISHVCVKSHNLVTEIFYPAQNDTSS